LVEPRGTQFPKVRAHSGHMVSLCEALDEAEIEFEDLSELIATGLIQRYLVANATLCGV